MKIAIRAAAALALTAGLLAPAFAQAQTSALHDGVVVDAERGVAYVMSPQGGIDALDLATGNIRWTSKAAVKPLGLADGALLAQAAPAQAGELPVVTLDGKGEAKQRLAIALPSGLRAQAVDSPTGRFRAEAFTATDGALVVTWSAVEDTPLRGMVELDAAEGGEGVHPAAVSHEGAARVDLATGRVAEMADKGKSLQLSALRAGASAAGKNLDLRRQLGSLDGRHVLTTEPVAATGGIKRFRWTITDASGATIGTVESPISRAAFVVAGGKVLYVAPRMARVEGGRLVEEPLRLQAVDLRSGSAVWSSAIVDTAYRGMLPP